MDRIECEARFGDPRVRGVDLPSRNLIVLDTDSSVWKGDLVGGPGIDGSIVWLRAPHDAPDGIEQRLRDELTKQGAMKVKVLPREQAPSVVRERAGAGPVELADSDETRGAMRATAEVMAREVATGDELTMLLDALDEALTEAGL